VSEFDLNATIRDALERWKEPDPHVVARRLLAKIPPGERDRLVLHGLTERVTLMVRVERQSGGNTPRQGRSRWQRFAQRVNVAGEWKRLGDCTAEDVDWLAADRAEESARLAAVAQQFRMLAAQMRAAGVATVADLGDDVELQVAA
jgi:hypothetical protein